MSLFDNKESMVRILNQWDAKTYGEAFAELKIDDSNREVIALLGLVIDKQGLAEKPMNGFSSEGLKKDEFERMGVCYVDFINTLQATREYWTPLDVMYAVCENNIERREFYEKKAKKLRLSFEKITWMMCGRALRALPSFIREYQLCNELMLAFPKASFARDEDLDRKFHCDVLMEMNEKKYYFWSFLSTSRSLVQFVDKFRNNRYGHVPDGTHVLCPFDRKEESDASYKGWSFYSSRYINEIKTAIYQKKPIEYNSINLDTKFRLSSFKRPVVVEKQTEVNIV